MLRLVRVRVLTLRPRLAGRVLRDAERVCVREDVLRRVEEVLVREVPRVVLRELELRVLRDERLAREVLAEARDDPREDDPRVLRGVRLFAVIVYDE